MIKERPILMNGAMVRATLSGTKSQTRRLMKPQPEVRPGGDGHHQWPSNLAQSMMSVEQCQQNPGIFDDLCPRGHPGQRLWVRESWYQRGQWRLPAWPGADADDAYWSGDGCAIKFAATDEKPENETGNWIWRSRPSIHMPRWASRILLEVTGVRIERLQEISDADIEAEGINMMALAEAQERYDVIAKDGNASGRPTLRSAWRDPWESTGGDWDANPWLWAISFRRVAP